MTTLPPDYDEPGTDGSLESGTEAGFSRRNFLVGSAAGAVATFLAGRALATEGTRRVPAVTLPADEANFVVQETPSGYFLHRENGSEEMNWGRVGDGELTPNDRMYVHSRARPPRIDHRSWRLEVTGDAVGRPRSFTYGDLLAMPSVTLRRTLDCGANCRAFFPKLPPGGNAADWLPIGYTQWHFGAVGAAEWAGVRARDVLAAAGLDSPLDVRFTALDDIVSPTFPGGTGPYSQAIPADQVLRDDTLLAYRMNRTVLPVDHGFPLRLIVSGWGGNTFVKWLGGIEASKRLLGARGPQLNQVLTGPAYAEPVRPTVGRVRSALEQDPGLTLDPGDITLHGRAWSGSGAIRGVDVSVEKLVAPEQWVTVMPWQPATLLSRPEPFMWVRFEVAWPSVEPGQYRVMSRAADDAGNAQPRPEDVVWNQHGLGYNGHAPLGLVVLPPTDMP
jgi:DMSO/TMAO reductase YedYZ molybdopterin-dependent catalytic subunit